jgi:hypothetical protein
VETTATEKLKIRSCGCCGTSIAETELAETGSAVELGPSEQSSRTVSGAQEAAGTCDCGCECCKP